MMLPSGPAPMMPVPPEPEAPPLPVPRAPISSDEHAVAKETVKRASAPVREKDWRAITTLCAGRPWPSPFFFETGASHFPVKDVGQPDMRGYVRFDKLVRGPGPLGTCAERHRQGLRVSHDKKRIFWCDWGLLCSCVRS